MATNTDKQQSYVMYCIKDVRSASVISYIGGDSCIMKLRMEKSFFKPSLKNLDHAIIMALYSLLNGTIDF